MLIVCDKGGWWYCGRLGGAPSFSKDKTDAKPISREGLTDLLAELKDSESDFIIEEVAAKTAKENRKKAA